MASTTASDIGVGGEQQSGRLRANCHRLPQDLDPAHPRHPLVRENHVHPWRLLEKFERLGPMLKRDRPGSPSAASLAPIEHVGLIVHQQQDRSQLLGGESGFVARRIRGCVPVRGARRRDVARGSCASPASEIPRGSRAPADAFQNRDGDPTLPRFVVSRPCRRRPESILTQGPERDEPLDERHLVSHIVVSHFIDHSLTDQEAESAGAEPELLADVEMRERITGDGGMRQLDRSKPGPWSRTTISRRSSCTR